MSRIRDREARNRRLRLHTNPSTLEILALGSVPLMLGASLILRDSALRYMVYLSPWLLIAYAAGSSKGTLTVRRRELTALLLALFVLCFAALRSPFGAWQHVIFILVAFAPVAVQMRLQRRWLFAVLALLWLCQLWIISQTGVSRVTLITGAAAAETHTIPFLAALLAGIFLVLRCRVATFLAVLLAIVGGKRIALLALIIGAGYWYLHHRYIGGKLHLPDRKWQRFMLYGLLLIPFFSIALYLPTILADIAERYDLNPNIFSAGRFIGQERAYDALDDRGMGELIFGSGLGQADFYAEQGWGRPVAIHNDYLRMVIDFGILGSIVFLVAYLRLIGTGMFGPFIVPYTAVLWLTDNVLIYVFYALTICLIILVGRQETQQAGTQKRSQRQNLSGNLRNRVRKGRA